MSAIPLYYMSCLRIPKKIIKVIEKGMRKFFWNDNQDKEKIHLLAWDKICQQKDKDGAGIRKWNLVNKTMGQS